MHDYFRGNPNEQAALRVPPRARADPGRVPRPRRPRSPSSTSSASRRCGCSRRSASSTRSCSSDDVVRDHADVHRVQPLARRRLGLRLPGPDLRGAVHLALRPRLGDPRARVGDRPRRAHDRDAARRAAHRRRPDARERSAQRSVLGARAGGRHHRRRARGRQRLLEQRLRGRRLRGRRSAAAAVGAPNVKAFAHRARRARLPHHARVRQAVRALPRRAHRVGRERLRLPRATCSRSCASTEHKMPGYFTEDPVESFRRNIWINPFWEDDVARGRRADGRRPRDLRLRLAAHRGHAPAARLRGRAQGVRRRRRSARSCATTPAS